MTDYYRIKDDGCCLICKNASKGCLCFECKCTKCDEYNPRHGCCNYPEIWAEEREIEFEENQKFFNACLFLHWEYNQKSIKILGEAIKSGEIYLTENNLLSNMSLMKFVRHNSIIDKEFRILKNQNDKKRRG